MCHVEECKFQLGSFQYRGDQLRFVLADLVQDEERRNVLLDHLTLTQLQAYTEYLEKAPIFPHPTLKNLLPLCLNMVSPPEIGMLVSKDLDTLIMA